MQASHCKPEAPREADPLGKTHLICQGADLDKIADTESEAHPVLVVEVSCVAMKCARKLRRYLPRSQKQRRLRASPVRPAQRSWHT